MRIEERKGHEKKKQKREVKVKKRSDESFEEDGTKNN